MRECNLDVLAFQMYYRIEGIGGDLWGGALRASYDFVLGPVSIQANYSNQGKNVGFYINAGFVF